MNAFYEELEQIRLDMRLASFEDQSRSERDAHCAAVKERQRELAFRVIVKQKATDVVDAYLQTLKDLLREKTRLGLGKVRLHMCYSDSFFGLEGGAHTEMIEGHSVHDRDVARMIPAVLRDRLGPFFRIGIEGDGDHVNIFW